MPVTSRSRSVNIYHVRYVGICARFMWRWTVSC